MSTQRLDCFISALTELLERMFDTALDALRSGSTETLKQLKPMDERLNVYQTQLQAYLADLAQECELPARRDAMLARVSDRTRVVCLANPNNPTGSYVTKDDVRRLHAGLPKNVLLVIDAAYAEYVSRNDYESGVELVDQFENVVMTRTFSKIYGMGGLRLGWMYGPAGIVDVISRLRQPFNVNLAAQLAGIAALEEGGARRTFITAVAGVGLGDGRPEIDVPERGRLRLIREPAREQTQERSLRRTLRPRIDRGVGHRPVHGESQVPPQVLEGLLVLRGQPVTQLDEIGSRDRNGRLARSDRRLEAGVVGQRGITPHAVVVLDTALRGKPVVVPPHGIEDGLAPHPMEPGERVGMRVREDVADVQRPTHRGRGGIDRVDVLPLAVPVERVDACLGPARVPLLLESFERGFVGKGDGIRGIGDVRHVSDSVSGIERRLARRRRGARSGARADPLDFLPDETLGHTRHDVPYEAPERLGGLERQPVQHASRNVVHHVVGHRHRASSVLDQANGPTYFPFDPGVLYEIKVDNDQDAVEDVVFQFRFTTENRAATAFPGLFASVVGGIPGIPPITKLDGEGSEGLALRQTYTVAMVKDGVSYDLTRGRIVYRYK